MGAGRILDMSRLLNSDLTRDFGRIAPFSDAVVAVAMTALVLPLLDIKIDETGGWSMFFDQYGGQVGAFFYGFFVIAVYWAVHHKIWGAAKGSSVVLLWLNIFWLLGIVLIPFGTVLLYESGGGQAPLLGGQIFCAILTLVSVAMGLLIYVVANDGRISNGTLAPQPFWWTQRYAIVWALAWLAVAFAGRTALEWMWIAGVLMFPLSAYTPAAQRAWADRRAAAGETVDG